MTDFLYAKPTWIDGVMSIVDLFGVALEFNDSKTSVAADARAYFADVESLTTDAKIACGEVLKTSYAK